MAAGALPKMVTEALGHSNAGSMLRGYVYSGMDETERMNALMELSPVVTPRAFAGAEA